MASVLDKELLRTLEEVKASCGRNSPPAEPKVKKVTMSIEWSCQQGVGERLKHSD